MAAREDKQKYYYNAEGTRNNYRRIINVSDYDIYADKPEWVMVAIADNKAIAELAYRIEMSIIKHGRMLTLEEVLVLILETYGAEPEANEGTEEEE